MQDLAVRFSARGHGTVTLGAAPDCELTALAPASCGAAGYLECDYTEGYAAIATTTPPSKYSMLYEQVPVMPAYLPVPPSNSQAPSRRP